MNDTFQKNLLVKDSTLKFFREGRRLKNYSLFNFLHGYVYGRWLYLYIGIGTGEHWVIKYLRPVFGFFNLLRNNLTNGNRPYQRTRKLATDRYPESGTFADTYHGKVVPLDSARSLVTIKEDINLGDLEQVIPYKHARDIVLHNPSHIVVLECPCRSSRPNPCLPLDVCLVVGEPFASFVIEHHPQRARWIDQNEAVAILEAENKRGHVHHAFFKDAMLGRFYAICNCCACCCGAMQSQRNGTPMLASSGYVSQVDEALCIGCTDCLSFCQFGALYLECNTARINTEKCMGCGICVDQCLQGALQLKADPSKGMPLEIFDLINLANHQTDTVQI